MKRILKNAACFLLALLLAFGPVTDSIYTAFADYTGTELAPNGQTWEEAYPDGAFIFRESYQYTEEGDDTVAIAVYRMGGREGTAIADIAITPVVPDGNTANAAGLKDFEIISPEGVQADTQNEYDSVFLKLEFEAGEYEKNINIKAIDDILSEPEEIFIATIYGAEGAQFIEDANRYTMCIQDNDPYVDSHAVFTEKELSFDRSKGTAILEVTRTGGTQYVFSVDYKAISGTALEGVDFARTSGTLAFNCGQETATIEIPLVNDNIKTADANKYFDVMLSNPKGGDILENSGTARVSLYNSAENSVPMNVATLVTDSKAVDISGRAVISDKAVITNSEEIKAVPEIKESLPLLEAPAVTGGSGKNIIADPSLKFLPNQGTWKKLTRLAYREWALESCGLTNALLNPKGLSVSDLQNNYDEKYKADFDSDADYITDSSAGGQIHQVYEGRRWRTCAEGSADPYGFSRTVKTGIPDLYQNYKTIAGSAWLKSSNKDNRMRFMLSADDGGKLTQVVSGKTYKPSKADIDWVVQGGRNWTLAALEVEDSTGSNHPFVAGLKEQLEQNKYSNYQFDRPTLALLDYNSLNNVSFDATLDYLFLERAVTKNLKYEVLSSDGDEYLESVKDKIKPVINIDGENGGTDDDGKIYVGSQLQFTKNANAGSFKILNVELAKIENGYYRTINKGYENNGNYIIGLYSNSNDPVGKLDDISCLNSETADYSLVVRMQREQTIEIDCSPCILPYDSAGGKSAEEYVAYKNGILNNVAGKLRSSGYNNLAINLDQQKITVNVTDILSFDMGLNGGDQLLYGGTMYSSAVPINENDYLNSTIGMVFYDNASLSREQPVRLSCIESIRMYLDENGNNTVDEDYDTMLGYLDGEREANSEFAPQKGKDGNMKQKLLKYDYVIVPRKIVLTAADDLNLRYDMRAGFKSAIDFENMTPEMKMYREINTGDTKIPVYGASSSKGSITIPLGGDYNPPVYNNGWSWDQPDFNGNLRNAFVNPASITENGTVVGNKDIPTGSENEYLGSFRNTDQIILEMFDNKNSMIDHFNSISTCRDIVLGDFQQNQNTSGSAPGSDNSTTKGTPGTDNPSVSLPNINIPAGPFKVVMEGDTLGFELGIPLFGGSYSKKGDSAAETEQKGLLSNNRSKYLTDMKNAIGKGEGDSIFQQLSKAATDSLDDDFGTHLKPATQKDASFMVGVSAAFMWKYDKTQAKWIFDEAKVFVTFHGEVKVTQRIPPVPVVYVYIIFSVDARAGINIDLQEVVDANGLRTSKVKLSGEIGLEIAVEAGAGVGVDLCKLEIYLRVNIGLVVEITENTGIKEFSVKAAVAMRVVLLCFTFEMEAVSFKETYTRDSDPQWQFTWAVFGKEQPNSSSIMRVSAADGDEKTNKPPRVKLRMSARTYEEQVIGSPAGRSSSGISRMLSSGGPMLASIPTDFGFELGEYNDGAAAVQLANNLKYRADYKLFTLDGKNYILYLIDGGAGRSGTDADMLVMSEIGAGGLKDPTGAIVRPFTVVDRVSGSLADDPKGDSDFDVQVDGKRIKVAWIDNQVVTPDGETDYELAMKNSAANTQLKYTVFDAVYAENGFAGSTVIGTPDTDFNFLPKAGTVGSKSMTLHIKSEPFTEEELNSRMADYKESLISQLNVDTEEAAKEAYPYFDFKVMNKRYTDILYGKYSEISFGVETAEGFKVTGLAPTEDWKNKGTRVEQADFYSIGDSEFYMTYVASYNYLDQLTDMTAKHMYLRKGTINGDGTVTLGEPLILRSLVDSEDNTKDGVYEGGSLAEEFADPFFAGLEFIRGKLRPEGAAELILVFNMNNRYYYIDEVSLTSLINQSGEGTITPFFSLNGNEGDSKGDLSMGTDGDGNISIVYTMPVAYSDNNAIYLCKYDPYTKTWGKGIMLAMRDMELHERSIDENWTAERTMKEYYDSANGDAKLIFQKPRIILGESGSLLLVAQTVLTNLEEVFDPIKNGYVKMPAIDENDGTTLDSTKGFYAISFPVGERKISSPSLQFGSNVFVTGSVLTPRVSFKNAGDFAIRGSEAQPIDIRLMLGDASGSDGISLARWTVVDNIPSGETFDTLLNSENSVYGQVGTQLNSDPLPEELDGKYLYFTVQETGSYPEGNVLSYSSLDTADTAMMGKAYYSTDQNKPELVLEDVTVKQGGEIITVNGIDYLPLDITAQLKNYGKVAASDISLKVEYRETSLNGDKAYIPLSEIGLNGVVSLGDLESEEELQYSVNNGDYEKDADGNYIFLSDGNMKPYTDNDLLIPLSYFDANSKDKSLGLRIEATIDQDEFETTNNIAYPELSPLGSIKMEDMIYLIPGVTKSFDVEIESSSSETDIRLMELQQPGKTPIFNEADMSYDDSAKKVNLKSEVNGETVLRIADMKTAASKDVIVKVVSVLPEAPVINKVLAQNAKAYVYFDAPQNTGGAAITSYTIACEDTGNEKVITRNTMTAGRYEFTGLTNGRSYRFKAAAQNIVGVGPWTEWTSEVTPIDMIFPPLDAVVPDITIQPEDKTAALGEEVSLSVQASASDGGALSYQWYSSNSKNNLGGSLIEDATDSVYTPGTNIAGEAYYYCLITNTNNNVSDYKTASAFSSVAEVIVEKGDPVVNLSTGGERVYSDSLTLTATINGIEETDVTGTVRFESMNGLIADQVPISGGVAAYSWKSASPGNQLFRVVYYGDGNYNAASAEAQVEILERATNKKSDNTERRMYIISASSIDWSKSPVFIDMSAGTWISAEVFARMAELYKDRYLVLSGKGYTITFAPGSLKEIPGLSYYDFGVVTDSGSNSSEILRLAGVTGIMTVHFNHNGKLPGEAEIKLNVGAEYAGKTIYYYYYNESTGKLEYIQSSEVDKEGYVTVKQSTCSDYVFTSKKLTNNRCLVEIQGKGAVANTMVPCFTEAGKDQVEAFCAAFGETVHLYGIKDKEYTLRDNAKQFADIAKHWAKPDIDFITARELLGGTAQGVFNPEAPLTRGMMVTALGRLWGAEPVSHENSRFRDVKMDSWYGPYVEWALENGIVSGMGNGSFEPDRAVTREEMAVILTKFAEFTGIELKDTKIDAEAFADEAKTSAWAKAAVNRIQRAGIINGKPGNLYDPKGICTRAEVSSILRRIITNMVK